MEKRNDKIELPAPVVKDLYLSRFGRITYRVSIACALVTLFSVLAWIIPGLVVALMWLFAVSGLILSFGAILGFAPDLFDKLSGSEEVVRWFAATFGGLWRIFAPVAIALAAGTIVMLILNNDAKEYRNTYIGVSAVIGVSQIALIIVGAFVGVAS